MNRIKVVIIGDSNCGKSTLVNALCSRFVVPESTHTSTIVTTIIGKYKDYSFECALLDNRGQLTPMTLKDFRTNILYGHEGIYADTKSRYINQTAFVNISHPLSACNMAIVDTIGTGINPYDTEKTANVVKCADIIVYVHDASRSYNLLDSEVAFLKRVLFPQNGKPFLSCDRILIVPNKIDCIASVKELICTLINSLALFVNKSSEDFITLCNNIVPVSALSFRIAAAGTVKREFSERVFVTSEDWKRASELIEFEENILHKQGNTLLYASNVLKLIETLIKIGKSIKNKN